jgi:hypothetical protein
LIASLSHTHKCISHCKSKKIDDANAACENARTDDDPLARSNLEQEESYCSIRNNAQVDDNFLVGT